MNVELQTKTPDYIIPNNSIKDLKDIQFKIEGVKIKSLTTLQGIWLHSPVLEQQHYLGNGHVSH